MEQEKRSFFGRQKTTYQKNLSIISQQTILIVSSLVIIANIPENLFKFQLAMFYSKKRFILKIFGRRGQCDRILPLKNSPNRLIDNGTREEVVFWPPKNNLPKKLIDHLTTNDTDCFESRYYRKHS
ncbi:hypothetical protein ACOME3_005976 [Neoechinorhynchus agilis]